MTSLEENIDQFLKYFRDRVDEIKNGQFGPASNLFKKILYVGILDALSKTVSYPNQGNRDRFVSLIRNFSDWKYAKKISLPHLVRLLQKVHSPEFSDLRAYAYEKFDKWVPGNLIELESDPDFEEVKRLWPSTIPKPLERIDINSVQHVHLFYFYRNSLVHELRQLGRGIDIRQEGDPYYYLHDSLDSGKSTWELIYPIGFYENISNVVIDKLHSYYIKDRVDPYSCFTFGSYWIEELNK